MVINPCRALGGYFMEYYGTWMTLQGVTHPERLCQYIHCPDCGAELAAGSLENHQQVQQIVGIGDLIGT